MVTSTERNKEGPEHLTATSVIPNPSLPPSRLVLPNTAISLVGAPYLDADPSPPDHLSPPFQLINTYGSCIVERKVVATWGNKGRLKGRYVSKGGVK